MCGTRRGLIALLVLTSSLSAGPVWAADVDCKNKSPVDCYTAGVKQVEEALGRVATMEAQVKSLRDDLKNADDDLNSKIKSVGNDVDSLTKRIPTIVTQSLEFVVYSSGLKPPDAVAKCEQPEEVLIGGSCLNRQPGAPIGNNQVGIGPVYSGMERGPITQIKCQRYTGDGSLQIEAFAVCMRPKKPPA
jgi:hypothetical protein